VPDGKEGISIWFVDTETKGEVHSIMGFDVAEDLDVEGMVVTEV